VVCFLQTEWAHKSGGSTTAVQGQSGGQQAGQQPSDQQRLLVHLSEQAHPIAVGNQFVLHRCGAPPAGGPVDQVVAQQFLLIRLRRGKVFRIEKRSLPTLLTDLLRQRADALPQQHPSSAQSSLANTLRAGMRSNEEWQDSNSFIYTDPRFEGKKKKNNHYYF
jgi:hypothetical protein